MESGEERALLAARFEQHAEEEGRILARYRVLAEKLGAGPLGFVLDLILTEEEMHHLLLRNTAKWLREPPAPEDRGIACAEILRHTAELRRHEQETITAGRELKEHLPEDQAELLRTLVDVMILDSRKHDTLLALVEKLLAPA